MNYTLQILATEIRAAFPLILTTISLLVVGGLSYLITRYSRDHHWYEYVRLYSNEITADNVAKFRARAEAAELALKASRQDADNLRALVRGANSLARRVGEILQIAEPK